MARPKNPTPTYALHRASGRGRLIWTDAIGVRREKLLPGLYNSTESLQAKARLKLEICTSPTRGTAADAAVSVAELFALFFDHAQRYYVDADGCQTKEVAVIKYAIRPVRELDGATAASEFGPVSLKTVRQHMIGAGLSRALINRRVDVIKRAFKWAASEELVPVGVYQALQTLPGLRAGRTEARETDPVGPVADEVVDATLPHLPQHVRAMIQLMRFTGMRPNEVCGLTLAQIDRAGEVWTYTPRRHKTAYKGKRRVIPFGPSARQVLTDHLSAAGRELAPDEFVFSPVRAREERFALMRANRKSKVQPSQLYRQKANPKGRMPTAKYLPTSVSHAVWIACTKAFPAPAPLSKRVGESARKWKERLTVEQAAALKEWQTAHSWTPYQLRHSFATRVRREHGLEAAQVLLGHTRADVTQVYAERNEQLASRVAEQIG